MRKLIIFDLDDTLVSHWDNLLIKEDTLAVLKELYLSSNYILGIASFNESAQEILKEYHIDYLFTYYSCGTLENKEKLHPYSWSKIDNVLEIMRQANISDPRDVVFLDNEPVNCRQVINVLKVPSIIVNGQKGITILDMYMALDFLEGKMT